MSIDKTKNKSYTVGFGGEVRELWTNDGLSVSYSGQVSVLASWDGSRFHAVPPPHNHSRDVKHSYAMASLCADLAAQLNSGGAPSLTLEYFNAAATVARVLDGLADVRGLSKHLSMELSGGLDAVILPELLRVLLDECGCSWDDALDIIRRCFVFRSDGTDARIPLGALAGLQSRDAGLVRAVNEKLGEGLWNIYPGDWARIGESSILQDGEICLATLCVAMCGNTICTKEERAGRFRTLFALTPAVFKIL